MNKIFYLYKRYIFYSVLIFLFLNTHAFALEGSALELLLINSKIGSARYSIYDNKLILEDIRIDGGNANAYINRVTSPISGNNLFIESLTLNLNKKIPEKFRSIQIKSLYLTVIKSDDLNKITIDNMKIDNLLDARIEMVHKNNQNKLMQNLLGSEVVSMVISITDKGIIEHVLNLFSKSVNSQKTTAKSRVLLGIFAITHTKYKNDETKKNNLVSMYKFIDNKGTIKLTLVTENGLSLLDLAPLRPITGWRGVATWFFMQPFSIEYSF